MTKAIHTKTSTVLRLFVVGLMATTSCGTNSEEASAEATGVEFCDKLSDTLASPTQAENVDESTADDLEQQSKNWEAVNKLVPADAPESVIKLTEAFDNADASATENQLAEDKSEIVSYLQTTCTNFGSAEVGAIDVLIPGDSSTTQAAGSSNTESVGGTVSEDQIVVNELSAGPAAGRYRRVDLTVKSVTASNVTPKTYSKPVQEASSQPYLFVDVSFDAPVARTFEDQMFRATSPNGDSTSATTVVESDGTTAGRVKLSAGERKSFIIVFETSQLVGNAEGWTLEVSEATEIPELIALDGSEIANSFPLDLVVNAEPVRYEVPQNITKCGQLQVGAVPTEVQISDDQEISDRKPWRAEKNRRIVAVKVEVTNYTDNEFTFECLGMNGPLDQIEFRLEVKGERRANFNSLLGLTRIESNSTGEMPLLFDVPKDVEEIALFSNNETELGRWDIDLPPHPSGF